MEFVREGDELVVLKLDRLGRNTRDVLNLVHELRRKGGSKRAGAEILDGECRRSDPRHRPRHGRRTRTKLHARAAEGWYRESQGQRSLQGTQADRSCRA